MNLTLPSGEWHGFDPLYMFLPLALARFLTVPFFSVQRLGHLFGDRPKDSA